MWNGMHGGLGWGFGGFAMALLWIALVAGIVVVVRLAWDRPARRDAPTRAAGAETPLDVLERRFASGEIDRAEFEEKRKLLS